MLHRDKLKEGKMKKLIVFDADGVLLDNKIGAFKEILVLLGKEKEVEAIDEEYQRRKFAGPWGLEQLAGLYKGISQEELKIVALGYCQNNLMKGAKECLAELKRKSYIVGALSSNPRFIMDTLSEILLLDFAEGTGLEFRKGVATGKIVRKVDRYIKAQTLEEKMNQLGFRKQAVVIVGDSITDLPMAERAGFFIAFNAKEEVKEKADVIVEEKDLRKTIDYIENFYSGCSQ